MLPDLPGRWPEMTPGQRLRWARKARQLTQARVAAATGISAERLQRLERDTGKLAPREALALLRALDLPPASWLLGAPALRPAGVSPRLLERLDLLSAGELRALQQFVVNLTEGRARGQP